MNNKEKGIIFNRAEQYRRAYNNSYVGTWRRDIYSHKFQTVLQVIRDLGLESEFIKGVEE